MSEGISAGMNFPPASILKKLEDVEPGAAEWVMSRMERLGIERGDAENAALRARTGTKSFVSGVFKRMCGLVDRGSDLLPLARRNPWEAVGGDMRKAMREFCTNNPGMVSRAGLSTEELQNLGLVSGEVAYGCSGNQIR